MLPFQGLDHGGGPTPVAWARPRRLTRGLIHGSSPLATSVHGDAPKASSTASSKATSHTAVPPTCSRGSPIRRWTASPQRRPRSPPAISFKGITPLLFQSLVQWTCCRSTASHMRITLSAARQSRPLQAAPWPSRGHPATIASQRQWPCGCPCGII